MRAHPAGRLLVTVLAGMIVPTTSHAGGREDALAEQLGRLDTGVIVVGKVRVPPLASMLARDVGARTRAAARADGLAWQGVKTRESWERFRDARLRALRASLGDLPAAPGEPRVRTTATRVGDGYRVDSLVYEGRAGLPVTASLYRPARPAASMPGLIVCLSHQQPKHNGARQDMGMTWARAGCVVLVPDHLGHGERRQHPFGTPTDSAPHDYHFRYDLGIQLHLVGESLMGWLAWDMMRGVDVLLAQAGVDTRRIVLISEPAGGGDVAAVTAALDPRISGVMVNNFGGPEPEDAYPLPRDAEESFDYVGAGSWESTRNLRLSARDGFLPWVIVAAAAPRRLIYYHEFYWDRDRDPVWQRLRRVYELYDAADSLTGLAGRGFVVGSAPENTHWLAESRELLYPVLERWYRIPSPKKEYSSRLPPEQLLSLTPEARKELRPRPLHEIASEIAAGRTLAAREKLGGLGAPDRRDLLRRRWAELLGDVTPQADPRVQGLPLETEQLQGVTVERIHLSTEPGIVVPVVLLLPPRGDAGKLPVVVGLAQEGKQKLLHGRAALVAEILSAGAAVCLADVRGTGETSPGEGRDRRSASTSLAAGELMLGQTLLGGRLRDLRALLRYLRQRPDIDGRRIALWGDSLAPVNAPDRSLAVPYTESSRPGQCEPLGGLLALLGSLFEEDVCAVYARGGLSDYQSVLQGPFCYLPYDAVVPGVLTAGDLCDLAAGLAPRPLWLDGLVDGQNRAVPPDLLGKRYAPAQTAYDAQKASKGIRITNDRLPREVARWLTAPPARR